MAAGQAPEGEPRSVGTLGGVGASGSRSGDGSPLRKAPDNGWSRLRQCESTDTYDTDTGNTLYGAYQFTWDTWQMVGGSGNPAHAPPIEQDLRAGLLYDERGGQPWPICKRVLTGPMPNPVTLEWPGVVDHQHEFIVFFDPDSSLAEQATVTGLIEGLSFAPHRVRLVSQAEALVEFRELFADDERIRESVTLSDMPPSLRVTAPAPPREAFLDELRGQPGVFEVVATSAERPASARFSLRVEIERLGLAEEPLLGVSRLDDLLSQVAAVAPAGWGDSAHQLLPAQSPLVLASAALGWDLDRLTTGDRITVSADLDPVRGVTAQVQAEVAASAVSMTVAELVELTSDIGAGPLVLVAPDPDDTDRRIVVTTRVAS